MKFDILSVKETSCALKIEGGRASSRKNSTIERHGIRRIENGRQFQASKVGAASAEELLEASRASGGPGIEMDFTLAPEKKEHRIGPSISLSCLREFEEEVGELVARYPDYVFGGSAVVASRETSLISNYGLDLRGEGSVCEWSLLYQKRGSKNMFDGVLEGLSATPDFAEDIRRQEMFIRAQDRIVNLKSGRYPVLLGMARDPLSKLTDSLMSNKYHEGSCVFAGKLGEKLFSEQLSFVDCAYDPKVGQNQFFDGEGVVRANDNLTLIERGVFKNLIYDQRYGKKFGQPSTGNAQRLFDSGVSLGFRSPRIAPGKRPWLSALKDLDVCIVAAIAAGGESNELGEYSTPVQVGYVFQRGELIGLAPQMTVKTSVSQYLGSDLIEVCSDSFFKTSPGGSVIAEMQAVL